MKHQLTFLSEEPPARVSASPDCEKDWMMSVATLPSSFVKFLEISSRAGSFGKTCPASYPPMTDGTLPPSFQGFGNAGMGSPTEFLTLNISEWPSEGAACSLSDILETGDLPLRYFLSAKACRGILRRADKRGKTLPRPLMRALEGVAQTTPQPAADEPLIMNLMHTARKGLQGRC